MKIKGENTIDSGLQYCNFKMTYEIDVLKPELIEESKKLIKDYLKADMKELYKCMKDIPTPEFMKSPKEGSQFIMMGGDVTVKWTYKDGKWSYEEKK